MISKITKLKKFGIFQDFKPAKELREFNKFNLLYGWNGSGKSTLAKLFYSIQDKIPHNHFEDAEFSVTIKDIDEITHKNIGDNSLNIKVFNQDFIDRNVNFEQSKTNSILILSEEKKEEMDKYKNDLEELKAKNSRYDQEKADYTRAGEELKKSLSKWASGVKKSFELIETTNSYFLNYDRTKINNFIKARKDDIKIDSILSPEEVKDLKSSIKPTKKDDIIIESFAQLDVENTKKIFTELTGILSKSIISNQLERLTKNPEINNWVQLGLGIHKQHETEICEFCNQQIPNSRITELNEHFSKEYDELVLSLENIRTALEGLKTHVEVELPDIVSLYDEFHGQFQLIKEKYEIKRKTLTILVQDAKNNLLEKAKNPFSIITRVFTDVEIAIFDFNSEVSGMIELFLKHNSKNLKFEEEVKKSQDRLELHFVCDTLITEKYSDTEKDIAAKRTEVEKLEAEITILSKSAKDLELILINEAVGADSFNRSLEKFIGRKDISIEFDKELKGYKLKRVGKTKPALNLSEGEKTAIAFVYFISKLKENGNKIEESIIVVDDPISSFDSNHLFHSYSYLKNECEGSKQLIILTHNFQYFKLIRDWMLLKNKTEWKKGVREEIIKSHFYSIDCTVDENRISTINNANKTLLDFNSEYHYIFHKLYSFKDIPILDLEKTFLIANLSRKLLEGFLTFKFPKKRKDFSQLMQVGCEDIEVREKVYRFINKYSHNQQIEFHDAPIDNLLAEGGNIITDVFGIINALDKAHHDEMLEVCNSHIAS